MQGPSTPKKRRLSSECMTQTMTNFCYLDTNIRLSINFNDVKVWTNLIYINLSKNMITNLPRAFGGLPHLRQLNLSHNCLGSCDQIKWPWMRQTIKNTLLFLDISYNLLTELPSHIGRLNALMELNVSHNMLKCLPHSIEYMQSLKILDVSYNSLLYLQIRILFETNLNRINISMNSFPVQEIHFNDIITASVLPTLYELSAKAVHNSRIQYESLLPGPLVDYLDMAERCYLCHHTGIDLLCQNYSCPAREHDILEATEDQSIVLQNYICFRCRLHRIYMARLRQELL